MTMKLTKEQVDQVFEKAEHQEEAIIGLYKLVFPEWDNIASIAGFPYVGHGLSEYIWQKCIQFDKAHHPNVMPGGMWLNNGWSTKDGLDGWSVDRSESEVIMEEADDE